MRDGYGEFESDGNKIRYEGYWVDGLKHGFGKLAIKDGMTYEGDWVYGIKQGHGKIKWPSNNFYEGEL